PGNGFAATPPGAERTANGFQIQFASHSPVPTPAVHQGMVLVSGGFNSHEIYAYEAGTGRAQWGDTASDHGPSNPVCDAKPRVFNSESCTTFAVDAKTGKVKWSWWLGDPETSTPTIAHGMVFASYPANGAYAYAMDLDLSNPPRNGALPPHATHVLAAFDLQ